VISKETPTGKVTETKTVKVEQTGDAKTEPAPATPPDAPK
jgi:hypothetical protein